MHILSKCYKNETQIIRMLHIKKIKSHDLVFIKGFCDSTGRITVGIYKIECDFNGIIVHKIFPKLRFICTVNRI
jgi:hypothetical protein